MLSPEVIFLCVQIIFCRILDVSLGTVRMVLTVKGKTSYAAAISFFESVLWFLIVRQALNFDSDEGGLIVAVAYATGFASGTFIGGKLSSRFIKSEVTLQIVTSRRDDNVVSEIRKAGFAVTVVNVNGSDFGEEKYLLFAEIPSKSLKELKALVHSLDKKAFVMVQETKHVFNGYIRS